MAGWRNVWFSCVAICMFATASFAETLADVRQDLAVLLVEIRSLQRELSTTDGGNIPNRGTYLQRIAAIEGELRRLTNVTEQLEFRISAVSRDGSARIKVLEEQLCALQSGCVIGDLGDTLPLGAIEGAVPTPMPERPVIMTVTEQIEFEAARSALESGDLQTAIRKFGGFTAAYPGGPKTQEAFIYLGRAHDQMGDYRSAARSYLEGYSQNPDGQNAASALYQMGIALWNFEKPKEACLALHDVTQRFAGTPTAGLAAISMQDFACTP